MSNIVPFAQAAVPAFVSSFFGEEDTNVSTKNPIPALSFRGKTWRISLDDQEQVITNREGEPSATVSVFVLDQVKARSRVFYEGSYVAGENKAPRCSSIDGVKPDASIAEPIAATCASCPNAAKGSKITAAGKATTACATTKRVAVVPAQQVDFKALLLRLAQTSMWDKNNQENETKGWYAWDQYMDFLRARGVTHTAQVVTKIKFDHRVEYPKLLFSADRWATEDEMRTLAARWKSQEVQDLLMGTQLPEADDDGYAPPPAAAPAPAAAAAPAPTRAPRAARPAPAPAPAPAAAPAPAPAPAAAAPMFDEPAAAAPAPAPAPAAAAPAPAAAAPATGNTGLSSLLGEWDD